MEVLVAMTAARNLDTPHDLQKLIPKIQDFEETYPNHSDIFRYIQIYHQLKNCFFTNQHADVYPASVISVISFMTSADLPPQRRCSDLDGERYRTGPVKMAEIQLGFI